MGAALGSRRCIADSDDRLESAERWIAEPSSVVGGFQPVLSVITGRSEGPLIGDRQKSLARWDDIKGRDLAHHAGCAAARWRDGNGGKKSAIAVAPMPTANEPT